MVQDTHNRHQPWKRVEGLDPPGETEVVKEKPSTETWEDRWWKLPSVTLHTVSVLAKTVATSHMWLVSTENVTNDFRIGFQQLHAVSGYCIEERGSKAPDHSLSDSKTHSVYTISDT